MESTDFRPWSACAQDVASGKVSWGAGSAMTCAVERPGLAGLAARVASRGTCLRSTGGSVGSWPAPISLVTSRSRSFALLGHLAPGGGSEQDDPVGFEPRDDGVDRRAELLAVDAASGSVRLRDRSIPGCAGGDRGLAGLDRSRWSERRAAAGGRPFGERSAAGLQWRSPVGCDATTEGTGVVGRPRSAVARESAPDARGTPASRGSTWPWTTI